MLEPFERARTDLVTRVGGDKGPYFRYGYSHLLSVEKPRSRLPDDAWAASHDLLFLAGGIGPRVMHDI